MLTNNVAEMEVKEDLKTRPGDKDALLAGTKASHEYSLVEEEEMM